MLAALNALINMIKYYCCLINLKSFDSCKGTLLSGMFFRKRFKLLIFLVKILLSKKRNLKNKNNRKICHLRMPMLIVLVGDPATLGVTKSLDSRYRHSGMTELLFRTVVCKCRYYQDRKKNTHMTIS